MIFFQNQNKTWNEKKTICFSFVGKQIVIDKEKLSSINVLTGRKTVFFVFENIECDVEFSKTCKKGEADSGIQTLHTRVLANHGNFLAYLFYADCQPFCRHEVCASLAIPAKFRKSSTAELSLFLSKTFFDGK